MTENTKKYIVTRIILAVAAVLATLIVANLFLPLITKILAVDLSKGQPVGVNNEWANQAKIMSEQFNTIIVLISSLMIPYVCLSAIRKFDLKVIYASDNIVTNKLNIKFWGLYTAITCASGLISPALLIICPVFGLLIYSENDYRLNRQYFINI